ncbi:MAG: hypothetical protein PHV54_01575 [Tolumonas sp.]|nr:hypothetical protein [Tolumonas sp.]
MQTLINHLNDNFARAFDVNSHAADVLADELGRKQSIDEKWQTYADEKAAFVEKVILNGGDFEGLSLLSVICNTTGHNGITESEIDSQLKAHMKVIMESPDSTEGTTAAKLFNHILRDQITAQVRERIDLEVEAHRIRPSWRSS